MSEAAERPDLEALEGCLLRRSGRRVGGEIKFLCPSHDDKRPSARWSPVKSAWFCDVCRVGGGWRDLAERLGVEVLGAAGDRGGGGRPLGEAEAGAGRRREVTASYAYTDGTGRLLYEVQRLEPKGFSCRRPDGGGGWIWNLRDVERVLYRLPEVRKAVRRGELVWIVEGEKDADTLAAMGFTATTNPGGAGRWQAGYSESLRGARVVVVPDNDQAGCRHADEVVAALVRCAAEVRRVALPALPAKGDVSDWLAARRGEGLAEELARCRLLDLALCAEDLAVRESADRGDEGFGAGPVEATGGPVESGADGGEEAVPGGSGVAATVAEAGPVRRVSMHGARCLADVAPEAVRFLWEPYLPLAKLTLLDGDPGQGKSWLTAAIAAAGSRGNPLPGNAAGAGERFSTLFLCEDEVAAILRPRLDALGADHSAIHARDTVSEEFLDLSAARDIGQLEEMVVAAGVKLVVVDPMQAFLGRVDVFRANEVRAALGPLLRLAHRRQVAVLVLRHLTKVRTARALYSGQGSMDFVGAARSVLLAGARAEDGEERALVHIKSNLAAPGRTLGYRLAPVFTWKGEVEVTAQELLAPAGGAEERGAEEEARDFLRATLEGSEPLPARLVMAAARDAGIAARTLRRAKKQAGVRVVRRGWGPGSVWLWAIGEAAGGGVDGIEVHRRPGSDEESHAKKWPPMGAAGRLCRRRGGGGKAGAVAGEAPGALAAGQLALAAAPEAGTEVQGGEELSLLLAEEEP